jgi:hypothetical protein
MIANITDALSIQVPSRNHWKLFRNERPHNSELVSLVAFRWSVDSLAEVAQTCFETRHP